MRGREGEEPRRRDLGGGFLTAPREALCSYPENVAKQGGAIEGEMWHESVIASGLAPMRGAAPH